VKLFDAAAPRGIMNAVVRRRNRFCILIKRSDCRRASLLLLQRLARRVLPAALAPFALGACGGTHPAPRRLPDGYLLVQKGAYQILYAPNGRPERALQDANGDGVAEAIVLYGPDGRAERVEHDTDGDHVVDRRETWHTDASVDLDDDGEGRVDHPER
jgi:hypothetical protein